MAVPLTPLFKLGSAAAAVLPGRFADGLAEVLGSAIALERGDRKRLVERHQQRAHGGTLDARSLDQAVRSTYRSYARYWADSLRLPTLGAPAIDNGFSLEGFEHIEAALAAGIGPIVALPHMGSWEWAAAYLTRVKGWPVSAVVERLEPPELFEWFLGLRRELGMDIIPLGPTALGEVSKAIKASRITCLLCDRDLSGSGVEVEFFGERTTLPSGPATLAIRTGAPLLPTGVMHRDGKVHGVVGAPIDTTRSGRLRADVERITQDLAYRLEILIRRAPTEWHLMQPNWPSDYDLLRTERNGGGSQPCE